MLGELLRDHRCRLGLTQEELADRAGLSVRTISHVETGRIARPRPATVRRLAEALALTGAGLEEFQRAATGISYPAAPAMKSVTERHEPGLAVPAQLPPTHPGFTGRAEQLAQLDALLEGMQGGRTGTVVISALAGTAGVGKTALAVHWASRVADRFPDGQLYVNLRGFHPTGAVMTPAEAVRGFLDAFEIPAERVPPGPDAQFGLYRSLCAGKRLLVLLDNARDAEQVRPLLPGAPGCLALVTSRNQLTGLVAADGAQPLNVDLLTVDEARQLLARRLGPARLAEDPHAMTEIITRCARLPLALSIVAARAAVNPGFPLTVFASELRGAGAGLDPFIGDDPVTDVRAVFSWSYHRVGPEAARLFRLLGLYPGPDITERTAASLAALRPDLVRSVRPLLSELTRAHLLDQPQPGRYTLHDLLRAYATELTHEHDTEYERRGALHRLLDHYLQSAATASDAISWYRDPIPLTAPAVAPEELNSHAQAMAWFATELPNLTAAVRRAARAGFETHAWQLAWAMVSFFDLTGHWQEWVTTHQLALDATRRSGDTLGEARTRRNLARVRSRQGRHQDALVHLRRSLTLSRELGDPVGQAQALRNMSNVLSRRSRHEEAMDLARQALALFEAADHRIGQGRVLNQIGWQLSLLGNHQQAVGYCRHSLRILQELGDRDGEGATWDSLGYAHHHLGDYGEAIACFNQALRLRQERGDLSEAVETLDHLATTHLATGDRDTAARCWRQSLQILDHVDHTEATRIRERLRETAAPEATPPDVLHLAQQPGSPLPWVGVGGDP